MCQLCRKLDKSRWLWHSLLTFKSLQHKLFVLFLWERTIIMEKVYSSFFHRKLNIPWHHFLPPSAIQMFSCADENFSLLFLYSRKSLYVNIFLIYILKSTILLCFLSPLQSVYESSIVTNTLKARKKKIPFPRSMFYSNSFSSEKLNYWSNTCFNVHLQRATRCQMIRNILIAFYFHLPLA